MQRSFEVRTIPTRPCEGQKTGTSGLRKKVSIFRSDNYLQNWVQALFNTLEELGILRNSTLVLGGDGRFFNSDAIQIIIKMAAANGVRKIFVGRNGILSTPAVSAIIRRRRASGGIILTASHNPGGENADFGIKYNTENGAPAPEKITDKIFPHTLKLESYKLADIPNISLEEERVEAWENFEVEVIDSVEDYLHLIRTIFPMDSIKRLLARPDFKTCFDSMNGVTGVYSQRIFRDELGVSATSLLHANPKPDFGGLHPDPNLTYAAHLVRLMDSGEYQFGAAWDGDGDRNMILGSRFFVNPSDSVAVIAANAEAAIPYFREGLGAVARSMPTSAALDRVAHAKNLRLFEVPTGWKFFCNVMDTYPRVICGEESFGTGSDHIREKDGIWAVLAWLSILAHRNQNVDHGASLVTVEQIVKEHWQQYGRNYFTRYDYEEVEVEAANGMMSHVHQLIEAVKAGDQSARNQVQSNDFPLKLCDDFEYRDPIDGSFTAHQGYRFIYEDGSRIIFRLSGTGSAGATIRLYIERFESHPHRLFLSPQEVLEPLIKLADRKSVV